MDSRSTLAESELYENPDVRPLPGLCTYICSKRSFLKEWRYVIEVLESFLVALTRWKAPLKTASGELHKSPVLISAPQFQSSSVETFLTPQITTVGKRSASTYQTC